MTISKAHAALAVKNGEHMVQSIEYLPGLGILYLTGMSTLPPQDSQSSPTTRVSMIA